LLHDTDFCYGMDFCCKAGVDGIFSCIVASQASRLKGPFLWRASLSAYMRIVYSLNGVIPVNKLGLQRS
jgi:hypothetical protein